MKPLLRLKYLLKRLLCISWCRHKWYKTPTGVRFPGTRYRNFWCDSKHWAFCYTCRRLQQRVGVQVVPFTDQLIVYTRWGGWMWQRIRNDQGQSMQYHYQWNSGCRWKGGKKKFPFAFHLNGKKMFTMEVEYHLDYRAPMPWEVDA